LCGKRLGATIGIHRRKGCLLILRRLRRTPKNFARSRVEQPRRFGLVANHFQQPQRAQGRHLAGGFRDFETQTYMALAGEMIQLVRRGSFQHAA